MKTTINLEELEAIHLAMVQLIVQRNDYAHDERIGNDSIEHAIGILNAKRKEASESAEASS